MSDQMDAGDDDSDETSVAAQADDTVVVLDWDVTYDDGGFVVVLYCDDLEAVRLKVNAVVACRLFDKCGDLAFDDAAYPKMRELWNNTFPDKPR